MHERCNMEHSSCDTTNPNSIRNSIHDGTQNENSECHQPCHNINNGPMSDSCGDSCGDASAPFQAGMKTDSDHDEKDNRFGCGCKLRKEPRCSCGTPKWKLLLLAFVSILILVATIATSTSRETSLGLLSPESNGGPIPALYSGQLIGSPLQENVHATNSGILPETNSSDNETSRASSQTPELSFLIELLSPIVSQISEREGTHLTDFVASRRNDESIVLKGSPQHNALVWLSHAIVCTKGSNNNTQTTTDCASLLSRSQLVNRYSLGTMYFAWNGKSWKNARGWLSYDDSGGIEYPAFVSRSSQEGAAGNPQKLPSDVCLWKGVTCRHGVESDPNKGLSGNHSSDGDEEDGERIVGLDLSGNNLVGYMGTAKEIRLLKDLEALDLSQNHLEGLVPREFGMLEELQSLDVSQNLLSGTLPSLIAKNLTNLEVLKLEGNFLMGGLEEFLFAPPCSGWREFSADCYGDRPRVECPCCTKCCGTSGSLSPSKSLRGSEPIKNETILCREQNPGE